MFSGKNAMMTHNEYSLSDWNDKNQMSINAELDEKATKVLKERMKKAAIEIEMEMKNEKEKQKKKVRFLFRSLL
jgi:hypothetical protein